MAFALSNLRTDLDNILGTAVDSATWTTTIKDEAVRQALKTYDESVVYEASFTVASTAYTQDLSSITDLNEILSLAYPWSDGADYLQLIQAWRYTTGQTVYFRDVQPAAGDTIRVRYTKNHTVNTLDSASSTTVPDRHQRLLALSAAAYACQIRIRQLSENPAVPRDAITTLQHLRLDILNEYHQRVRTVQAQHNPAWTDIGL